MSTKEPNRSNGGTFIRDKDGKLLEHIPPTKVPDASERRQPDAAKPAAAGKKAKE